MARRLVLIAIIQASVLSQDRLTAQVQSIVGLMPDATSCVVFWNPKSSPELEAQFGTASATSGIRIIQASVQSPRELTGIIKALSSFQPDFILLTDDRMVSGKNSVRFIAKHYRGDGVPVFGFGDDVFKGGGYGELYSENGEWRIRINGSTRNDFRISIPEDSLYSVVN